MTEEERALVALLLANDQQHLFASWEVGKDEDKKHAFFQQVCTRPCNTQVRRIMRVTKFECTGQDLGRQLSGWHHQLRGARAQAARVLGSRRQPVRRVHARGASPTWNHLCDDQPPTHSRNCLQVPTGVKLDVGTADFDAAEALGVKAVKDAAFVLVAGGLGERLGYGGIKVALPTETTTGRLYLQLYIEQILALQAESNRLSGGPASTIPLAIMTSDDTHSRTEELLRAHSNFGAAEGQVILMKQEKVAAITDNSGHFALEEGDAYTFETKPHGHGDVHSLLLLTGLARKWASEGRRHVVFFQDTNALCFTVSIAALGVSAREDYTINSIAVPRKAKDAVGAITRLVRKDGSSITVNVEYNQLEPMLKCVMMMMMMTMADDGDYAADDDSWYLTGRRDTPRAM